MTEENKKLGLNKISNAWVSPYGLVATKMGLVKSSQYPMFPDWKNIFTFIKKITLRKVKKINSPCLVCLNPFFNNYYHWLAECMPRIYAAKEIHKSISLIIPEEAPVFVWEYISLFEFKEIIKIKENELIHSPEVYFTNHLPYAVFNKLIMIEMSDYILSKFEVKNSGVLQKIFITRANAKYRKSNEEENLFEKLQKEGYNKHFLEEMNVKEQINLFYNSGYVAGIHGAGFTNILFSKKGKAVLDFIHKDHKDKVFECLAIINNIEYKSIMCEGTGKLNFKNNDDLIIPFNNYC